MLATSYLAGRSMLPLLSSTSCGFWTFFSGNRRNHQTIWMVSGVLWTLWSPSSSSPLLWDQLDYNQNHHHAHHQEHDLPPQSLSSLLSQLFDPAFLWGCLLLEECCEQFKCCLLLIADIFWWGLMMIFLAEDDFPVCRFNHLLLDDRAEEFKKNILTKIFF